MGIFMKCIAGRIIYLSVFVSELLIIYEGCESESCMITLTQLKKLNDWITELKLYSIWRNGQFTMLYVASLGVQG